jgi:hypothetical protein
VITIVYGSILPHTSIYRACKTQNSSRAPHENIYYIDTLGGGSTISEK